MYENMVSDTVSFHRFGSLEMKNMCGEERCMVKKSRYYWVNHPLYTRTILHFAESNNLPCTLPSKDRFWRQHGVGAELSILSAISSWAVHCRKSLHFLNAGLWITFLLLRRAEKWNNIFFMISECCNKMKCIWHLVLSWWHKTWRLLIDTRCKCNQLKRNN